VATTVLFTAAGALRAQAPTGVDLPVVEDTLDNGLRIVVLPRKSSPTVSFVVRYGVGSVNEHVGDTGISHLIEHMLFKGTTTVGTRNVEAEHALFRRIDALQDSILELKGVRGVPTGARIRRMQRAMSTLGDSARTFVVNNEFDRILSRNGARNLNATTDDEATTYYVELPANRAKLWFVMEADRMENPVFREFYRERDVVAEERRTRIEDNPAGLLYEEHLASAFHVHPYGVPAIGYMSDIQNLTREQARAYYEEYYGARNAVVAVVGDVQPDSVLQWADAYLGRVRPGRTPDPVLTKEPKQRGERRNEVVFEAGSQLQIGWHVTSIFDADMPAVLMLSSILTGGRTSRLEKRLVQDERIATFVGSTVGPGELYPALFSIQAVPRSPHTTEELEAAIDEELDSLRHMPPDSSELQRVRNQLEASRIRRLESNLGLALQLASSVSEFGDWRTTFRFTDRLERVRPEDVRRIVRTYFTQENRTVTVLVPPEQGLAR